jgi:hypothetical protein
MEATLVFIFYNRKKKKLCSVPVFCSGQGFQIESEEEGDGDVVLGNLLQGLSMIVYDSCIKLMLIICFINKPIVFEIDFDFFFVCVQLSNISD